MGFGTKNIYLIECETMVKISCLAGLIIISVNFSFFVRDS